jgi:hypothetical protein
MIPKGLKALKLSDQSFGIPRSNDLLTFCIVLILLALSSVSSSFIERYRRQVAAKSMAGDAAAQLDCKSNVHDKRYIHMFVNEIIY